MRRITSFICSKFATYLISKLAHLSAVAFDNGDAEPQRLARNEPQQKSTAPCTQGTDGVSEHGKEHTNGGKHWMKGRGHYGGRCCPTNVGLAANCEKKAGARISLATTIKRSA